MKRIAVLTSGGDAPGMNAAIRAVTRCAISNGWEVFGIRDGYAGLIDNHMEQFTARSVGGIVQQGGTILGSARSLEFKTEEGRKRAIAHLRARHIEGLVVIGGNGSQTGACTLAEMDFPVVGVASTIDNDLIGSDITIGVDTAINIALEAIDRLKITASSHRRAFVVEVMGRDCGYIALMAGIAGGAELIVVPEIETSLDEVERVITESYEMGKSHAIVVVAEGAKTNVETMVTHFREHKHDLGFDLRATTLGHVQRGGAPTAYDRVLGTRLGAAAVEALEGGQSGVLTGMVQSKITYTPLKQVIGMTKSIDPKLFQLARALNM